MRTLQQMADIITARLMDGKGRCSKKDKGRLPICAYRNKEGNRCAIGALIPDEIYTPSLDMLGSVKALASDNLVREKLAPYINWGHLDALNAFQRIHDWTHNWRGKKLSAEGRKALRDIYIYEGLDLGVLVKTK